MSILFLGDRRSATAIRRKWRWEDGRLAGKQLFDALRASGIDPARCKYANAHERGSLSKITGHMKDEGNVVVAMGAKAQDFMRKNKLACVEMIHPAARGYIRGKARYADHVAKVLKDVAKPALRLPMTHGLVKAGEVWHVEDCRKGSLTIRMLSDVKDVALDDFFDGEIINGRVQYASVENRMNQRAGLAGVTGCVESFRTTLCNFMERVE